MEALILLQFLYVGELSSCVFMVFLCVKKYHHSSFQFSKAVDNIERVITLEKGVWWHTAWQLHENWCVNSALVDRENSWSHQSATLLVSPLTQIEFMGDTCTMFPHPRSYYKTIKCFIFTTDLLSVRTRHVKWDLLYIFIICRHAKHFSKIFFFLFFILSDRCWWYL